jgi:hypothetical protein
MSILLEGTLLLGFDAKEFERRKIVQEEDPISHELRSKRITSFYSPLGVGVKFTDSGDFKTVCLKRTAELASEFNVSQKRVMYDAQSLKEELSQHRAISFCDNLIQKLRRYIELVHFTFIVMPPADVPVVKVGGLNCPLREVKTAEFLRNLQPMFSYIAAWNYFGKARSGEVQLHLDSFSSKRTYAWEDLTSIIKPRIFPHGDECNPYIMIADLIAYLTDAKLYNQKLKLEPSSLQGIWESYGFPVETHFLDVSSVAKYRWYSEDPIDTTPYLAHPLVFLLVDELEKLQPNPPPVVKEGPYEVVASNIPEEKRFSKLIRRMEPWYAATACAYFKGGAAQLFNFHIDRTKVQDGDIMVYVGNKSKELAESFFHMYDIEVFSAKELRKSVNKEKIMPL